LSPRICVIIQAEIGNQLLEKIASIRIELVPSGKKREKREKDNEKKKMMHNELVSQPLPPPLPLSYEQDPKTNAFVEFINPHHHQQQPIDTVDSQQYANFIPHPNYHHHHMSPDEQFYSAGRNAYQSYSYPYALPPYPSLTLDTGR
jgi:hypothetical protein